MGVLDVKNGKTYLIAENIIMYAPPQAFDQYFSTVPEEVRNVIKAMSKQQKIIDFKVLEEEEEKSKDEKEKAAVAEEANEEKNNSVKLQKSVSSWLIKKWYNSIAKSADDNYDYEFFTVYDKTPAYLNDRLQNSQIYVIKTLANNIRSEIIRKPVSKSEYKGINGGFFDSPNDDYQETPTEGSSISYNADGGEYYDYNEDIDNNIVTRPTSVTYYDKKLQKTKGKIVRAKNMNEVRKQFHTKICVSFVNRAVMIDGSFCSGKISGQINVFRILSF
jgi:hypothetical protein